MFIIMDTTVANLTRSPFSTRTEDEKIKIISQGKPRPNLDKHVWLNFKKTPITELYDQEMWLTYCKELNSAICWTCLLFPMVDLGRSCFIAKITDRSMHERISQHKKSAHHISGLYQYHVFIKQKIPNGNLRVEEELEQKTKRILNRIIDVICFLVANEFPPMTINSAIDEFDVKNFIEALTALKKFDASGITEETINKIRTYPQIITKTIEAIAQIMKRNLKEEIQLCSYVSLVLTEYSKNSKLSVILRYISNGNICERFIDVIDATNLDHIKRNLLEIITEFQISSKLLSLSCDGGVLTIDNMSNLLESFQNLFNSCLFVPCHFHDFNVIVEQRLSRSEDCVLFFSIINSMKMFFKNDYRLCEIFKNFTKKKIPDLYNLKLSNGQFLRILKPNRRKFKAFFSYIAEHSEIVTNEQLVKAMGFLCVLEEYEMVFRIEAFYILFNHIAVLSDVLKSSSPEKVFDADILDNVEAALMKEKMNGFENLWTRVINDLVKHSNRESLEAVGENETNALLEFYSKVIDCVMEELHVRFRCVHKLEFLSILNSEAHGKLLVSDYQVKQIQQMHGDFIDKKQIINEMKVLSENSSIFGGKSVYEFMHILRKMDLKEMFSNVYRLGEIILTLPCKPDSCSTNSSKLDAIDAWISEANKPELKSLTFLNIEKDYLECLKSKSDFYESVICMKIDVI